jgi:hydrogenase expression/formation protein HypC
MCLAVPGQIKKIYELDGMRMGKIDFGGTAREVCLAYTPEAQVGDWAIVHVGFTLNLLSPEEAEETLTLLRQMAEAGDETERTTAASRPQKGKADVPNA